MAEIRLLLVEDHTVVREGLKALLDLHERFSVVGVAPNGAEVLVLFRDVHADVVLMDLQMPGLDGIAAILALKKIDPEVKVLVLTTYAGDEDLRRSVAVGAKGFLAKDCEPSELFAAIEAIAAGGEHFGAKPAKGAPPLSGREIDILQALARGLSNRQVADELFLSEATVRTHVGHIYTKLGVSDRVEAVVAASRRGIIRL